MDLEEAVDSFLIWCKNRYAARTSKDVGYRLRKILAATKGSEMHSVAAALSSLNLSPKSVNNYLSAWRGFSRWAYERGHVDGEFVHHIHAIPFRKVFPRPPRAYSVEEFSAVVARIRVATFENLSVFLVSTGLRISEAKGLTWGDIDLINGHIEVRGEKTAGASRTVATGRFGLAALKKELLCNADATADAHPWPRRLKSFRRAWGAAHPSWVPYRPPRALRHTFASWALAAGENVLWVKNQLGHTSLEMISRRYGQLLGPGGCGGLDKFVGNAVHHQLALFRAEKEVS